MGKISDCSTKSSLLSGQQFALVGYLPDPMAQYLDDLRLDLVPDCSPRAHVTILPPRPILGTAAEAMEELQELARRFDPFILRLGEIASFPVSNVVYIDIAAGREQLFEMYRAMNSGLLSYQEAFPYCPHITLAQRIPPDAAQSALEIAQREWNACRFSRSFTVETLHFVESQDGKCWRDLGEITLQPHPPYSDPIRITPAEPLYRA
jgi:2'-5' RNA ligase